MAYVTTKFARVTQSARGEFFNPLIYPFLLTTLAYGIGFTFFRWTEAVHESSLFIAMTSLHASLPLFWGVVAVVVIVVGLYVLLFDKPPIGKANCTVAWMLWLFAALVYTMTGGWLTLFAVAIPSLMFWTWQYFSLVKFRAEDALDRDTMRRYDDGEYDDKLNPIDSKIDREDNRGVNTDDRTPD